MSEKPAQQSIEDDANSAAVDAWRHPVERVYGDILTPLESEPKAEPKAEPKEPAKEPAKKAS